jgi:hypothetical protein
MSPPVFPRSKRSSLEEYRAGVRESGDGYNRADDEQSLFWRYVLSSPQVEARKLFDEPEWRVLNKTTTTAGGFLVPQDLESQIVASARAESVMAQLALELPTESGKRCSCRRRPRTAPLHGLRNRPGTRIRRRRSGKRACRPSRRQRSASSLRNFCVTPA